LRGEGILGTRSGVLNDNYASLQICTVCEREEREEMSGRIEREKIANKSTQSKHCNARRDLQCEIMQEDNKKTDVREIANTESKKTNKAEQSRR
jgi:hypothetical protein